MARGGYRAGAGRPRSTSRKKPLKNKTQTQNEQDTQAISTTTETLCMTPLEYMLSVMNCRNADDERRDRMAIAAAPYVHQKASDKKLGKKEQQLEDAKQIDSIYAPRRAPKLAVNNT